jgi:hypothetical protein
VIANAMMNTRVTACVLCQIFTAQIRLGMFDRFVICLTGHGRVIRFIHVYVYTVKPSIYNHHFSHIYWCLFRFSIPYFYHILTSVSNVFHQQRPIQISCMMYFYLLTLLSNIHNQSFLTGHGRH